MKTYADLIPEVRAQVDVSDEQARSWLADRARTMNAEAQWRLMIAQGVGDGQTRYWPLPDDCVSIDAVLVGGVGYERSTQHVLDDLYDPSVSASWFGRGVYAEGPDGTASPTSLQVYPQIAAGVKLAIRYVQDIPDPALVPAIPFPDDFASFLVDGAISTGLARMDERFDSAGYFETRFADAVSRLRRRRHGRVGRGFHQIRLMG